MKLYQLSLSLGLAALALASVPASAADWNYGAGALRGYGSAAVPVPAPVPVPEYAARYYFRVDGGIGFRFKLAETVVMRIDQAYGNEGYRFMWTFNNIF